MRCAHVRSWHRQEDGASPASSAAENPIRPSFLNLTRRFWNQILTCFSVRCQHVRYFNPTKSRQIHLASEFFLQMQQLRTAERGAEDASIHWHHRRPGRQFYFQFLPMKILLRLIKQNIGFSYSQVDEYKCKCKLILSERNHHERVMQLNWVVFQWRNAR